MKTIKDAKSFDELFDIKYGKLGTKKRDDFEQKAKAFIVGEMIKEARRLENGKIDIQISTLFKIF